MIKFIYKKLCLLGATVLMLGGVLVFGASHISCGVSFSVPAVNASTQQLTSILASDNFSKFTHSPFGKSMEPVNFIVVGSSTELDDTFRDIGWSKAAPLKEKTALKLAYAALLRRNDATAPVTPSCYSGRRQEVSYEMPTDGVRQRHHVRFWRTGYTVNHQPVWVGAASFDEDIKYLITHRIAPNIDDERNFIRQALLNNIDVSSIHSLSLVSPLTGKNQGGDHFYTDGKAYLVWLLPDA
ncbi:MAG: LssY C-terminal domain-containing protein [Patescibacteria group bacterium]|jgi:undecaprenyl-diphosphatase